MKLLEFLVEELKEWPVRAKFISDNRLSIAAFGANRYCEALDLPTGKLSERGGMVTKCEWQAAVDALNAPKVVEWDGEGLPPTGIDVEVMQGGLPSVSFDWEPCKILAINISSDDRHQVIVRDFRGDAAIYYPGIDSVYFRPIRTAEQVAAEERDFEIGRMLAIIFDAKGQSTGPLERSYCAALYDANYRKQVAP